MNAESQRVGHRQEPNYGAPHPQGHLWDQLCAREGVPGQARPVFTSQGLKKEGEETAFAERGRELKALCAVLEGRREAEGPHAAPLSRNLEPSESWGHCISSGVKCLQNSRAQGQTLVPPQL